MSLHTEAQSLIREAHQWKELEYVGGGTIRGTFDGEVLTVETDRFEITIRDDDANMAKTFRFNRVDFPRFLAGLRLDE